MSDAVSMFVAARRPFLSELSVAARRRGVDAARIGQLYDVSTSLLDRLLLAFVAAHAAVSGEPVAGDGAPGRPRAAEAHVTALLPALTSLLAFLFAVMLLDQWLERRQGFQAVWCFGMLCYGLGAGAEAIAAAERLVRADLPRLVPDRRRVDGRLAGPGDGVPPRPDAVRLHVRVPAPAVRARRAHDPEQPDVRRRRAAAAAVPHRRGHPRARDRGRDVLPEPALAAVRGGRDRRRDDPVARADDPDAAAARARATRCRPRRASRWATRCPATSGC